VDKDIRWTNGIQVIYRVRRIKQYIALRDKGDLVDEVNLEDSENKAI
jgi:hypothetical protein